MSQLAGRTCVICDERIIAAADAKFCQSCGNSVHLRCHDEYAPTDEARGCSKCGGQKGSAPVPLKVPRGLHPEQCLYVLAAIILVGAGLLIWPNGDSTVGTDDDESAEQSNDEKFVLPIVEIETNHGVIRAELFQERAPKTVENFVDLVEKKFYDGMIFHRVIRGFMAQTGDPTGTGAGGRTDKGLPHKALPDEFHPELRHDTGGLLSMANSGPNTGDSQFFITTDPATWLDDKHSIFGRIIDGMDVVNTIGSVETRDDRPVNTVKMISVRMIKKKK
mgnify:CR=1 FL=1